MKRKRFGKFADVKRRLCLRFGKSKVPLCPSRRLVFSMDV